MLDQRSSLDRTFGNRRASAYPETLTRCRSTTELGARWASLNLILDAATLMAMKQDERNTAVLIGASRRDRHNVVVPADILGSWNEAVRDVGLAAQRMQSPCRTTDRYRCSSSRNPVQHYRNGSRARRFSSAHSQLVVCYGHDLGPNRSQSLRPYDLCGRGLMTPPATVVAQADR
jgi:hypothetical protein